MSGAGGDTATAGCEWSGLVKVGLTQSLLNLSGAVALDVPVLIEEVSIDLLSSKEEDITVIGDGPLGKTSNLQGGTLCLCFTWAHQVWQSKQGEQLLGWEREGAPGERAPWRALLSVFPLITLPTYIHLSSPA